MKERTIKRRILAANKMRRLDGPGEIDLTGWPQVEIETACIIKLRDGRIFSKITGHRCDFLRGGMRRTRA